MQLKTFTSPLTKHFLTSLCLLFFLLLTSYICVAQNECLTPQEPGKKKLRYRTNPLIKNDMAQASYYLKIYVHVIRFSDGSGGFTETEVEEILTYLDNSFDPHQIYFVWDNEIDFIDDDNRIIYGPGEYYSETDIFTVNNHYDGIDLYLYPGTTRAGAGRANEVGEFSEFWVSGTKEGVTAAKSYVTAHEMGHVLNLWHTHHGCETDDWELIDGSNCETAGDFVCDTPADPLLSYLDVDSETCEWSPFNMCSSPESISTYSPDTKNIMSYTAIDCQEYFSTGQGERMRASIATLPYLQATVTNVSSASCNADDWDALKALYNATAGDTWNINTNWDILKQDTIPEECSLRGLHGITFDATGRVNTINLYDNNLVGNIPDEIGNLENLKYLDVGFNTLSDTINRLIGNLSELEILFLDNNQFVGGIPLSFLSLDKLAQLSLYNNNLSGCFKVEFGQWCGRFSANNFTVENGGNNFDASFDLFCDNAVGLCPIERCDIEDWQALKQFYNSTNGNNWTDNLNWETVTGNLPPIDCDLRKLRGISIDPNGRVMGLDLFDNNLTGSLPNELGDLAELTYIDLGYNLINDTIPSSISKLDKLISLYLDNNNFSGNIPASMGDLESIAVLYLKNNDLFGCPDTYLAKLCTQLIEDYNKNDYISEGNLLNIAWEDFCIYGVDSCEVSPCELEWYALKQLYLSTNGDDWYFNGGWEVILEDSPPLEDCNLGDLYGIDTDENGFVVDIDLRDNRLTGTIPPEVGNFTKLEEIRLYDNDITGTLPPEFSNLSNLTLLYLFRTQLTGEIPPELGNLTNLTDLALSENMLTGTIPKELGKLTNLVELYLSSNELTGPIPAELGNLQNLTVLLISENSLSGCYDDNLSNLCDQLSFFYAGGLDINSGNDFDALWVDFCETGAGTCTEAADLCNSQPNLVIEGAQTEEAVYRAAKSISSSAIITAPTIYKAGESIELKAGFELDGLNDFEAGTEDCNQ